MTIYERLDDETRKKLNATVHRPKKKRRRKRKNHEKLSEYDLRELMGQNRDRYHRVGGRVKRQ